jgi:hypothetical protein
VWNITFCCGLKSCIFSEPHTTAHIVAADISTHRALEWLLKQRLEDWSWGSDTPRAVLALQLANKSAWFAADNLESQLSGKQLELEIMLHLWRYFSKNNFFKFHYCLRSNISWPVATEENMEFLSQVIFLLFRSEIQTPMLYHCIEFIQ